MNLDLAKHLKYDDKIFIKYPNTTILGRFISLSKNGYVHYFASHSPPGQKAHRSIVTLHFDTRARFIREELLEFKDIDEVNKEQNDVPKPNDG